MFRVKECEVALFFCSGMFSSAYVLSMLLKCACVHARLLAKRAIWRSASTQTAHGRSLQLEAGKRTHTHTPCGSPAPAWSPSRLRACTCSSSASSAWSSPPCPDLSTETGQRQLGKGHAEDRLDGGTNGWEKSWS